MAFIEYVLTELKEKRLGKEQAIAFLRELRNGHARPPGGMAGLVEGRDDPVEECGVLEVSAPREALTETGTVPKLGTVMTIRWEAQTLERARRDPVEGARVLLIGGTAGDRAKICAMYPQTSVWEAVPEDVGSQLAGQGPIDHVMWMAPAEAAGAGAEHWAAAQSTGVLSCFRLVKALLSRGHGSRPLGWTVVTRGTQVILDEDVIEPAHAGVAGFMASVAREQASWKVRLIDLPPDVEWPLSAVFELPYDREGDLWGYRKGEWYRQRPLECACSAEVGAPAARAGGLYVLIGATDAVMALGEHWAREHRAHIVWVGGPECEARRREMLQRASSAAPVPCYIQARPAEHESLQHACEQIRSSFGAIHGVIAAADLPTAATGDAVDEGWFRSALQAQVATSVNVARILAAATRDFVVFSSSSQPRAKVPAQGFASAGYAFNDALAIWLSRQHGCRTRVISFDDPGTEMPQARAVWAVERLLREPFARIAVAKGSTDDVAPARWRATERLVRLPPATIVTDPLRLRQIAPPPVSPTDAPMADGSAAERLDALLGDLLFVLLQKLAVVSGPVDSVEQCVKRGGIHPRYMRWLAESLRVLRTRGYFETDRPAIGGSASSSADSEAVWTRWHTYREESLVDPSLATQVRLLDCALKALPDVLQGRCLATDVLFPQASLDKVEGVYQGNGIADYYNDALAAAVLDCVRERLQGQPDARLRLIEIGAGTGGTSANVLRKLDPFAASIAEYCYTDISRAFLLHGERSFASGRPYLQFRLFNAERSAGEQAFDVGAYDVVIAVNVLHATRNIRRTLRNVKCLLKAGGLLALNEMSVSGLSSHLTFGLLDGWWLYEDEGIRMQGCPALSEEGWRRALRQEGFDGVHFPARDLHLHGQQTILAVSDGLIREQRYRVDDAHLEAVGKGRSQAPRAVDVHPIGRVELRKVHGRIRDAIVASLCESLKAEASTIGPDDSFADYGVDSLVGGHVVQLINRKLGLALATTTLFDYSSVTRLTAHIAAVHAERIADSSHDSTEPVRESFPADAAGGAAAIPSGLNGASRPTGSPATATKVGGSDPVRAVRAAGAARTRENQPQPVAIIGMSARYPQSANVQELWAHLRQGDDLVRKVSRWDLEGLAALLGQDAPCRWGGLLDDIDRFDPLFFNISGLEATYMDPQQRLFLQESWRALEDAGYAGAGIDGRRCGVYAGYNGSSYTQLVSGPAPAQVMWGNSSSILSARIAYYLDLHGPAITIDTACSSSLVAIHLACQGLWGGETDLAMAGGVYVHSTPEFFAMGGKASMLSRRGRCFTFDERADGFVPGEGVGIVVLKRLADALSDRDHVYGVIRGSAINQDGTTNGITAPSARSQERLEREVYEKFGIDPREIGMVEAHGTGTQLGDPIEYEALKRAFGDTGQKQYCALGSIKTNIGHTLSAAGVAGVIKVLLALQHRQLPPSLHFSAANPHIDFENSPFYVNTRLRDWAAPAGARRLAAVSSFGFSGTNAHMVIEEPPPAEPRHVGRGAELIALSARSAPELRRQVEQLLAYCAERPWLDCGDMSFTLLVGRRHFQHRLAFVATREEIEPVLRIWLDTGAHPRVYADDASERVAHQRDSLLHYGEQCISECREGVAEEIRSERLQTLADLYTQGYGLPFPLLFDGSSARRVPLPTYPFVGDRYWPAEADGGAVRTDGAAHLHPLLHRNSSGLHGQRYSCHFTGREFFLADHRVAGACVLPAVAHLEMARAAVADAIGPAPPGSRREIRLIDSVWLRPLSVPGRGVDVHITLRALENGGVHYEIHSDGDAERVVHSKGTAAVRDVGSEHGGMERLDIARLQSRCSGTPINGADCYAAYRSVGIEHGPSLQGLEVLRLGTDEQGERFLLAQLRLPDATRPDAARYVLHPSLMDGAFQAPVGYFLAGEPGGEAAAESMMPFALDELQVLNPVAPCRWVYVTRAGDGRQIRKFDMRLCDAEGHVGVVARGLSSRVIGRAEAHATGALSSSAATPVASTPTEQAIMLAPVWDVVRPEFTSQAPEVETTLFLLRGGWQGEDLRREYPGARCRDVTGLESISDLIELLQPATRLTHLVWVAAPAKFGEPDEERIITEQQSGVLACFRLIKALLELGCGSRDLEVTIVTQSSQAVRRQEGIDPTHASVHGLIGSLAKEQSRWKIRLVDTDESHRWPWSQILRLPTDAAGDAWALRRGEWYRQSLLPCDVPPAKEPAYRPGGVYVIIGGAGGIGRALSESLVTDHEAHVIWIGRREEDDEIRACRMRLGRLGPEPRYIQADATDRAQLERAREEVRRRYGRIHGVVHSAIVLLDRSLANMDEERFTRALAAKVDVSVRLAQVFRNESLDFALFFSGLQSFGKMPGQSNYAAGCTFKDAHAHELARSWKCRVRVMNWGYWGSVGIVATEAHRQRMTQSGIGSIGPQEGMLAVERLLGAPFDQLGFIKITRPDAPWGPGMARARIAVAPSFLPSLVSTLRPPRPLGLAAQTDGHVDLYERFDACLAALLAGELAKMGLGTGPQGSLAQWQESVGIKSVYSRWLAESVRQLQVRGYLAASGCSAAADTVPRVEPMEAWKRWKEHKEAWLAVDDLRPLCALAESTLAALPAILTGKIAATDILFPRSSLEKVQGVYKDNASADRFNHVLCAQLLQYVAERVKADPAVRLRLFEIGAGTGGTSAILFTALEPYARHIEEYCYTDLSKAFLLHAEERYRPRVPYLTWRLFDAERSPEEQAVEVGSYDVVIATNVLHATRSIRTSLRNAKALLRGSGLLMLNEIVATDLAAHLTFGLLEGWWRFEDEALRIPGSPALTAESWRRILEEEGFSGMGSPTMLSYDSRQQVIVAESDGVIRRKTTEQARLAGATSTVVATPPSIPGGELCSAARGSSAVEESLRERSTSFLKKLVARTLHIKPEAIDAREPLQSYGIDSILIVQITDALREAIPGVTSTLLFEQQTISGLADFFVRTERGALMRLVGLEDVGRGAVAAGAAREDAPMAENREPQGRRSAGAVAGRDHQYAGAGDPQDGIAVIGLSGRYPQSRTLDEFWQNLKSGRDCITEIPQERWPLDAFYREGVEAALSEGKSYCKWGGFLDGFEEFDPMFFRIAPGEAQNMDPQERLFLQSCWEVLEDGGYTRQSLASLHGGRVGVFAGITKTGFDLYGPELWRQGDGAFPHTSFGSTANRVSYVLNLHGPSIPVDTLCSSSLTAIHLACESLLRGECELALAGGVNLYLHPASYVALCNLRMLSPDGRCKSFGAGGNGMVPGEGVGTVLLKPLSAAVADGDHIYGVIRGTSVNHGGKTSGYTVPSPHAQAELIRAALRKAGVGADTISYLEAHGTGTELGDPIEITALSRAFEGATSAGQFCAIGSVKSNIGHCESAAGIAGLTKVLLQMRYGLLVPSLHAQTLNPHIDFAQTPFAVQRELGEWKRADHPRRAGISSFGAGGANAHIVVEEYVPPPGGPVVAVTREEPAVIVLSARDEARLREQGVQLLRFIETNALAEEGLANVAYTLQVGREAMEERLALLVDSVEELRCKLGRWIGHESGIEQLYRGTAKSGGETLELFAADEDLQDAVGAWISKKKYGKLAELWVKGLAIDWSRFYGQVKPRRVSLPTYPFAKERYWVARSRNVDSVQTQTDVLHPLAQRNTSDLWTTRYTSILRGAEPWLADHVVNGSRVLPAAAYLEMARAAVCDAARGHQAGRTICLKDVVWLQPLIVGAEAVQVDVELGVNEQEEVSFEILSEGRVVHCRGTAEWLALERSSLQLQHLQSGVNTILEGDACYAAFSSVGLEYGQTHRGLRTLKTGQDDAGRRFVVANIEMPAPRSDAATRCVLQPSILDAALQGLMGLELGAHVPRASVPFAVERVEIFDRCPSQACAVIRESDESATQRKVDIELCDSSGEIGVRLRGLSTRPLRGVEQDRTVLLAPHWVVSGDWKLAAMAQPLPDVEESLVVLCGGTMGPLDPEPARERARQLEGALPRAKCLVLPAGASDVAERYTTHALELLNAVQTALRSRPRGVMPIQLVVLEAERPEYAVLAGLCALLETAQQENPALRAQLIEIEGQQSVAEVVRRLADAASCGQTHLRYRGAERLAAVMRPLAADDHGALPWKHGGVYLLSGGAGGLGLLFAREITERVAQANLILAGRGELGDERRRRIEELEVRGARVEYLPLDVSDRRAVERAVAGIRKRYGRLDGVIHAAGVTRDSLLAHKTEEELRSVLAGKVTGAVNLDETTADLPLDFFVLFGSMAATAGSVGQADYAAANAFLDEYARCRAHWVEEGKRSGRSLTVDWPLWVNGGMKIAAPTAARLDAMGWAALTDEVGIESFYAAIATGEPRVCVVRERPMRRVERGTESEGMEAAEPGPRPAGGELAERTVGYLKRVVAKALKVGVERLEDDVPLEQYGVDSILMMQMTQQLERRFGPLSKTLFFEYPSLQQLAGYFIEAHAQTLEREQASGQSAVVARAAGNAMAGKPTAGKPASGKPEKKMIRGKPSPPVGGAAPSPRDPEQSSSAIAIIGMSGRYPQARNLEEYWENLRCGRDSVTEVPTQQTFPRQMQCRQGR